MPNLYQLVPLSVAGLVQLIGKWLIIRDRRRARDFHAERDDDDLHHSRLRNHRAHHNHRARRNHRAHHNHRARRNHRAHHNHRARRNGAVPPAQRQVRNKRKWPTTSSETIKHEPISIDECEKFEIY